MTIILKLEDRQMDQIANALAQRPYAEVAQLIQSISQQIQSQQGATGMPQDGLKLPGAQPAHGNGSAEPGSPS